MKKQIVIARSKSAKELFQLTDVIKDGNYKWANFKQGEIVYVESQTDINLPNLTIHSITDDEIILAAI